MMSNLVTALSYDQASAGIGAGAVVFMLVICLVYLAAMWRIFTKAGEGGWKSIIPFVNTYTLFKIIYGNGWKFLLLIVPFVDVVISFAMYIRLAQAYGKSVGFGIGLIFLSPIFILVLAFGNSSYVGPYHGFI